MNDKKYDILYNLVTKGTKLTAANMKEAGIPSQDLTVLCRKNILTRTSRGVYDFTAIDRLYVFALDQIDAKNINLGIEAFKKCVEKDPMYYDKFLEFFLSDIINKRFGLAFKDLDVIFSVKPADAKFYLFLLNQITEVPEKYKNIAKIISLNEITSSLGESESERLEFNVRSSAIKKRYGEAMTLIKDYMQKNGDRVELLICIELLKLANIKQDEVKNATRKLALRGQYLKLSNYLRSRIDLGNASLVEQHEYYIVQKIMGLRNGQKPPVSYVTNTDSPWTAIENNDFTLALELVKDYIIRKKRNPKNSLLYILLKDTTDLIKRQDNPITDRAQKIIDDSLEMVVKNGFLILLPFKPQLHREVFAAATKSEFVQPFEIEDNTSTRIVLRYKNPIDGLDFIEVLSQADNLKKQGNPQEAIRLYKKVLSQRQQDYILYGKMGIAYIKANDYKNALNCFFIANSLAKEVNAKADYLPIINELKNKLERNQKSDKLKTKSLPASDELRSSLTTFIYDNLERVANKGIVLLEPMNPNEINTVHEIVDRTPFLECFEIDDNGTTRIALRYNDGIEVDRKELELAADTAIKNGNDQEAIEIYKRIIRAANQPYWIYFYIGKEYLRTEDYRSAVDYLTIAVSLAKQEGQSLEYSDSVEDLKSRVQELEQTDEKKFYNKPVDTPTN